MIRTTEGTFALILLLSSCSSLAARPAGKCERFLEELAAESPEAKALANMASGDLYLLGVYGFTVSFPGVDDPKAVERLGYRVLEGTSDAIWDASCKKYQARAEKYAARFNRKMLDLEMKNSGR